VIAEEGEVLAKGRKVRIRQSVEDCKSRLISVWRQVSKVRNVTQEESDEMKDKDSKEVGKRLM